MKKISAKKNLPLGISVLRIFYAINASLLFFTSLAFFGQLDIAIFGQVMPTLAAAAVRLFLVAIPLYLVYAFSGLKKESYPVASIYHAFFLMNAVTLILYSFNKALRIKPLLEITAKPEYRASKIGDLFGTPIHVYIIHTLSILIGLAILAYLFKKRNLFKN
jgi:hypothetical protein